MASTYLSLHYHIVFGTKNRVPLIIAALIRIRYAPTLTSRRQQASVSAFVSNADCNRYNAQWSPRLHEYLGGIVRGLGGFPEGIGGIEDHVHLLVSLKATHCLADLMRELKKASSIWVHDTLGEKPFAWQEGYAAFTVSASMLDAVRKYIANQEQHHRVRTFREELIEMLEKAGVDYNPDYL